MGKLKTYLMAESEDDMGDDDVKKMQEIGIKKVRPAYRPTDARHTSKDMWVGVMGNYPIDIDIDSSRPLTKKEIAFKKKLAYRLKTVSKFLGRNVTANEFNDIHLTLSLELDDDKHSTIEFGG